MIENPNWWEVNQLAILQAQWRIWTRNYQEQIQLSGLELQITSPKKKKKLLQVQRSATLPLFLHHAHIICFTL